MDDHPLLNRVTAWPGRGPTQLVFEALGFNLHRTWQNRIIEFCGQQQSELLHRYWDEVALETMQSLGQGNPDQRTFVIQPKCRSALLDELFAARDFVEPPFRYPPLSRCLFERAKKTNLDAEFRENESAYFYDFRRTECERLGIQTNGRTGKKRDALPFAEQFCTRLGFKRRRNRWNKTIDTDLMFEVGVDLGGNPYCVGNAPMVFRISHADDPTFGFDITGAAVFGRLVSGSQMYAICRDAGDYVLGIKAQIELFNVIAASFGQRA